MINLTTNCPRVLSAQYEQARRTDYINPTEPQSDEKWILQRVNTEPKARLHSSHCKNPFVCWPQHCPTEAGGDSSFPPSYVTGNIDLLYLTLTRGSFTSDMAKLLRYLDTVSQLHKQKVHLGHDEMKTMSSVKVSLKWLEILLACLQWCWQYVKGIWVQVLPPPLAVQQGTLSFYQWAWLKQQMTRQAC